MPRSFVPTLGTYLLQSTRYALDLAFGGISLSLLLDLFDVLGRTIHEGLVGLALCGITGVGVGQEVLDGCIKLTHMR